MARARRRAVAAAADDVLKTTSQPASIDGADIARRAYALYLARGCQAGHDMDDWMQAERELLQLQALPDGVERHE